MNVTCPLCSTVYRVDAAKVPDGGIRARCSQCGGVFTVGGTENAAEDAEGAAAAPQPEATTLSFGAADPHAKARRLARALVSDIVVYHPERRSKSLAAGTLRQEFREEIQKSWDEYVAQVGGRFGRETPYFREALNEMLAGGQQLF